MAIIPNGQPTTILALDVGAVRIGVARASTIVRLPEPLAAIKNDEQVWRTIDELCSKHNAEALIIGLPRGIEGQETAQTGIVRGFVEQLAVHTTLPIRLQDEAVTSLKAEQELKERGKQYSKGDIDSLAATYILDDYLSAGQHDKIIDKL